MDLDHEHAPVGLRTWQAPEGTAQVELSADEVRDRLAAVCPPGLEILDCKIVRLAGHVLAQQPDTGLGKLIDAVDVLIRPARDGMAFDVARLERIAAAFLAKPSVIVARKDKAVDVRALVSACDVIADATKLCAALDWPDGPLFRARVSATADGSAKPSEIAKALGVWGSDELHGEHALVARLGVVESTAARAPRSIAMPPSTTARPQQQ